jgi:hypothetical protein
LLLATGLKYGPSRRARLLEEATEASAQFDVRFERDWKIAPVQ